MVNVLEMRHQLCKATGGCHEDANATHTAAAHDGDSHAGDSHDDHYRRLAAGGISTTTWLTDTWSSLERSWRMSELTSHQVRHVE